MDQMTELSGTRRSALIGRLFAEFVVIVAGVLVALGANAAWEVRSERQREDAYYRALVRDLEADTAEYAIALRMTRRSLETATYVRSVILGDPLPATRSLSQSLYFASWVNYPDWASGTIEELYSAGTIRLIRDSAIKEALHSYRALVAEWRPRLQGPEYGAFQVYRRSTVGLIPLEVAVAYEATTFDDETVEGVEVDEEALARKIRGDVSLLRDTELMILQWASLIFSYDEQLGEAVALMDLIRRTIDSGPRQVRP
jgi:hypothetical protein